LCGSPHFLTPYFQLGILIHTLILNSPPLHPTPFPPHNDDFFQGFLFDFSADGFSLLPSCFTFKYGHRPVFDNSVRELLWAGGRRWNEMKWSDSAGVDGG